MRVAIEEISRLQVNLYVDGPFMQIIKNPEMRTRQNEENMITILDSTILTVPELKEREGGGVHF